MILLLLAPSAAALAERAVQSTLGPREVRYVHGAGSTYGCVVGGGPADVWGACFSAAQAGPGESAWLLVRDELVEGCVEVNVAVDGERSFRAMCVGAEGVDLGRVGQVIVGFREAGPRTATTGTVALEIRHAA